MLYDSAVIKEISISLAVITFATWQNALCDKNTNNLRIMLSFTLQPRNVERNSFQGLHNQGDPI